MLSPGTLGLQAGEDVSTTPAGKAQHAVVLRDDMLWDYEGPLPVTAFIDRFNRTEVPCDPAMWCTMYRRLRQYDLPEACRGDTALEERLAALFRRVLPEALMPTSGATSPEQ